MAESAMQSWEMWETKIVFWHETNLNADVSAVSTRYGEDAVSSLRSRTVGILT